MATSNDHLIKQRSVIEFLAAEGCSAANINARMKTVYGEMCISDCAVRKWENLPINGDCVSSDRCHVRPYSHLLGITERSPAPVPVSMSSLKFSSCAEAEWPAPDGSCMQTHCSPGKTLQGNSCVTAFDEIRGLGYNLQIWFELAENQTDAFPEYINGPPAKLASTILREKVRFLTRPDKP
ncbi:transposase [Plakobranchus ocellatus]|uniref:Transposase n=1 Tax=Plakobranchus ocellatus TaxID=259542 RepID=A0AAV4D216_9GAST|nr:transposase [Plakobranchus ocellatus]